MPPPVKKYVENKREAPFVRLVVVGTIRFLNLRVERYEQAGLLDFQSKFYSPSQLFFKRLPLFMFLSVFIHYYPIALRASASNPGGLCAGTLFLAAFFVLSMPLTREALFCRDLGGATPVGKPC